MKKYETMITLCHGGTVMSFVWVVLMTLTNAVTPTFSWESVWLMVLVLAVTTSTGLYFVNKYNKSRIGK